MRRKNKKKKWLPIISLILGVLLILEITVIKSYSLSKNAQAKENNQVVEEVTVSSLMEESKTSSLTLAGKIVANNTNVIKINPDIGRVEDILVSEGDTVKKGDPLFTYETDQQMKTKEAEFDTESQSRAVEIAKSQANIKWEAYNKKVNLLEKAKKENDNESATSYQVEVDQAYIEALTGDNEVKSAESQLEKSQLIQGNESKRLSADTIVADNDGVVKYLNKDLINQSKSKQTEENFMEIIDDSSLYLKGEVNEFDREKVTLEQPVELIDRKDKKKKWTGKIVQVANLNADDQKKDSKEEDNPNLSKFPFKVLINQEKDMPLIGSHIYVKVLPKNFETEKVVINKKYIISKNEKQYVWKVENKKITLKEVILASTEGDMVTISAGLNLKDSISIPKEGMKEGMEVGADVKS